MRSDSSSSYQSDFEPEIVVTEDSISGGSHSAGGVSHEYSFQAATSLPNLPETPESYHFEEYQSTQSTTVGIPDGDILIHAGDLTMIGQPDRFRSACA